MNANTTASDQPSQDDQPALQRLSVTVVTGEQTIYDGQADTLVLPGVWGQIAIRRNHAPLLAELEPGEMLVKTGDDELDYVIGGGFVEVRDNQAIVLADSAERAEDIDIAVAEAARRRAQMLVRRGHGATSAAASRSLALSRAQLRAAMRRRPRRRRR